MMRNLDGANVGASFVGRSRQKRNNMDVEGTEEGSRFWKKLGFWLGCMPLYSKGIDSSRTRSRRDGGRSPNGRVITRKSGDLRRKPVTPLFSPIKSPISPRTPRSSTPSLSDELTLADYELQRFSFNDLKLATRNFRAENFLGEGGFGKVLKGWISQNGNYAARPGTGIAVAVKSLNPEGHQGHKEWLAEVSYLNELHHPNLVTLVGYCMEAENRLLVYEYMPRGSLENHLFRRYLPLPWTIRMKIALGAAKGLAFLHEEAARPVIFRDFKTSNILLDANYNAKLSDFGLAKDAPVGDVSHVSTRVMGTQGYAAPEYVMTGHLTSKSDVYSFGVVLLELLTGRRAMDRRMPRGQQNLVEWLRPQLRVKTMLNHLMDPRLEGQYSAIGAHRALRLGAHCVRLDPKTRPLMSEAVRVLKSLPLRDNRVGRSPPFQRMQVGPNNDGGINKYGLVTGSSSGGPMRFQASPLTINYPLPPPNNNGGQQP